MNRLETYLRRAARGLWGRQRQEVMRELRGSIEARIWALEHQGLGTDEALEAALRELGDARHVSAGLNRVHILPRLLRLLLAAALAVVASVQPVAARVEATAVRDAQGKLLFLLVPFGAFAESVGTPEFSLRRAFASPTDETQVEFSSALRTLATFGDVRVADATDRIAFTFQGRSVQLEVSPEDARSWHRAR